MSVIVCSRVGGGRNAFAFHRHTWSSLQPGPCSHVRKHQPWRLCCGGSGCSGFSNMKHHTWDLGWGPLASSAFRGLQHVAIWALLSVCLRVSDDRNAFADHRHTLITPNQGRAATSAMSAVCILRGFGRFGYNRRRTRPRWVGASRLGTMAHGHSRP